MNTKIVTLMTIGVWIFNIYNCYDIGKNIGMLKDTPVAAFTMTVIALLISSIPLWFITTRYFELLTLYRDNINKKDKN